MTAELLAPAGSPECLETALYFGADAVYLGLKQFGLRQFAENFSFEELDQAVRAAHRCGRRVHVAMNALLGPQELQSLDETMAALKEIGPDAIIFSDPAVLMSARARQIEADLHLSTQQSTMNAEACRFWWQNGVRRIILARELSVEQIAAIRRAAPEELELEAFVHGAMCVAHSGRCLLSSVMNGRSGNAGRCAQPCRWEYEISEVNGDGRRFPIAEDSRGTYLLNAKDLMMIRHLGDLAAAGVSSFKIEGRNKSIYYVASVVNAYRRALDALRDGAEVDMEALEAELLSSSSRQLSTGFYYGRRESEDRERTQVPRRYTFVGKILEKTDGGMVLVEQRNKFRCGERLEILSPRLQQASFTVGEIRTPAGERRAAAPHPQEHVLVRCPLPLDPGDLLRRADV